MIPSEYTIGYKTFLGCKIDLSKKPLIPRVETEFWVEKEIDNIPWPRNIVNSKVAKEAPAKVAKVLDIFTGSGCIGVAVLKYLPESTVDFVDVSQKCLEQVAINCQINQIKSLRYRLIQTDIFTSKDVDKLVHVHEIVTRIVGCQGSRASSSKFVTYDYIFANPPYCLPENLSPEVTKYEPAVAVIGGGPDGLDAIKRFLSDAFKYLKPGGRIFMEHDDFQVGAIAEILRSLPYKNWWFHRDQFGRWRWVEIGINN